MARGDRVGKRRWSAMRALVMTVLGFGNVFNGQGSLVV